jgi:Phage protein (N4 Gp49/phage Sf6 gene 66) family
MVNGFLFVDYSAPVSEANYDAEVGRKIAYQRAFQQIWSHEGYLLRERLYGNGTSKP